MEFTGSSYSGTYTNGRMEGEGVYNLHTLTRYEGEMNDGMFHGKGILHFPNGGKYEGIWENGKCTQGLYTFSDGLEYKDTDWEYCDGYDRRFYTEICYGLKPAGESHMINKRPPGAFPDAEDEHGEEIHDPNTLRKAASGEPSSA